MLVSLSLAEFNLWGSSLVTTSSRCYAGFPGPVLRFASFAGCVRDGRRLRRGRARSDGPHGQSICHERGEQVPEGQHADVGHLLGVFGGGRGGSGN